MMIIVDNSALFILISFAYHMKCINMLESTSRYETTVGKQHIRS